MVRVTACVVPTIVASRALLRGMSPREAKLAMTAAMWATHANNINQKTPPVTMSHKLLTYGAMGKVVRAWQDGGKGYVEMEVDDASVPAEFLSKGTGPLDVSMSSDVNPQSETYGKVIEVSFCGEGARTGSSVTHLDGQPYKPNSTAYQHILSQPANDTPCILAASIYCATMSAPAENTADPAAAANAAAAARRRATVPRTPSASARRPRRP